MEGSVPIYFPDLHRGRLNGLLPSDCRPTVEKEIYTRQKILQKSYVFQLAKFD